MMMPMQYPRPWKTKRKVPKWLRRLLHQPRHAPAIFPRVFIHWRSFPQDYNKNNADKNSDHDSHRTKGDQDGLLFVAPKTDNF